MEKVDTLQMAEGTQEIAQTVEERVFLSVIVPAYNEEKRLPATLEAIDAFLRTQPLTLTCACCTAARAKGRQ